MINVQAMGGISTRDGDALTLKTSPQMETQDTSKEEDTSSANILCRCWMCKLEEIIKTETNTDVKIKRYKLN